jgi:hypothetical protein
VDSEHSPIGLSGTLSMATRGADGPGEVSVTMGGGTEHFIAYSEKPLSKGTPVVVLESRGARTVGVVELS